MKVRTPADIGSLVRGVRRNRGWSQQKLAAKARVTERWLREAEQGKDGLKLGLVLRVLDALDVAIDASVPGISSKHTAKNEAQDYPDLDELVDSHRGPSR